MADPSKHFRKACQTTSENNLAAQFSAFVVSGVPGAVPEPYDYEIGKKILALIEEEIENN